MSISAKIYVTGDGGLKQLDELLTRAKSKRDVNDVMGRAGANLVKKNFVALNKVGNALGGERTNFYGHAATSTGHIPDDSGATINIAQVGVRLIWRGGTVRPVVKKLLAMTALTKP